MTSVVMIAYAFPPEGNAGAYRPLRFVRQLAKVGWRINVISSDPCLYERYDPETVELVPEQVRVLRVRARDPWQLIQAKRVRRIQDKLTGAGAESRTRLQHAEHTAIRALIREWVRTAEAWCYHPDMAMTWIRPAVAAAVDTCVREKATVLWATAGPVSAFVVAERVSKKSGVPYVLDFRDPWTITGNDFEDKRPAWATIADRRAMYRILEGAQAVVFLYEAVAECFWHAYRGALDPSRIHLISNGYEGSIEGFEPTRDGERCTILYTGTLSSYRYDTLLESLCLLKAIDPVRARQLRLLVVGEGAEALEDEAEAAGLCDVIETRSATSRAEVARLRLEAHALLILGRHRNMRGHELLVGAKLFDYLKASRPIFGVLPCDQTKNILQRVGVTTIADADSRSEILAMLRLIIDASSKGGLHCLVPDPSACRAYSAERQTEALIRVLQGLPPAEPFVPGRSQIPASLRSHIGNWGLLTQAS